MSTPHLTTDQRIHRVAHVLAGAYDVAIDEADDLMRNRNYRNICLAVSAGLSHLGTGNAEGADRNRDQIAQILAELPNGDTTEEV